MSDDIKKIRHARFLKLLSGRKAAELAALLDVAQSTLSRIKAGPQSKGLGEDLARAWEKRLGLAPYWFDTPLEVPVERTQSYHGVQLTRSGALLAAEWEKLDVADRAEIEGEILARVAAKMRTARRPSKQRQS